MSKTVKTWDPEDSTETCIFNNPLKTPHTTATVTWHGLWGGIDTCTVSTKPQSYVNTSDVRRNESQHRFFYVAVAQPFDGDGRAFTPSGIVARTDAIQRIGC
jgi:hypothetical protein